MNEQKADRCPNLIGSAVRSQERPKEDRYRKFAEMYAEKGDPNTGIKPHAATGGEYLVESLYCPNCYVPPGFGRFGGSPPQSSMPVIGNSPVTLTDFEMVAVVAYLQVADTLGDYSQVTAKEDWERYFNRKLSVPERYAAYEVPPDSAVLDPVVISSGDTAEQIIRKIGCGACHTIPGVTGSVGYHGPRLTLKSSAPVRLISAEYQKAVREGSAHATTPREYVMESIVDPGAFIVPGFSDTMLKDFRRKLAPEALEKVVDFLLTLEGDPAFNDPMYESNFKNQKIVLPKKLSN